MTSDSLALCGAAGGVGTTRLTLEVATLLAREGRDVAVLDAAVGTQGLADRVPGRIDPDVTALCLDDEPLAAGLVDLREGPGRLAVCPARAPFERLARAKAPEAARRFEALIGEAERAFDHALVDTPPVAANQAVAAVSGAERAVSVCDAARASEALPRLHDRLVDVGVEPAGTIVTRTDDHPDADATVPSTTADYPALDDELFRKGIADAIETGLSVRVEIEESETGLAEYLPG